MTLQDFFVVAFENKHYVAGVLHGCVFAHIGGAIILVVWLSLLKAGRGNRHTNRMMRRVKRRQVVESPWG